MRLCCFIPRYLISVGTILTIFTCSCVSNTKQKPKKKPAIFFPAFTPNPRIQYLTSFTTQDKISKAESSLKSFLLGDEGDSKITIRKPYGIDSQNGATYICDTMEGNVKCFDFKNKKVSVLGDSGLGQLRKPVNIAIDDLGYKFIIDVLTKRIVVFDSKDDYTTSFTLPPPSRPVDVACYKDEVFVLDNDKSPKIFVLDRQTGRVRRSFGSLGRDPGQFRMPVSLSVTEHGIFVVDMLNFRIQKLTLEGKPVWTKGVPGRKLGQFSRPRGIDVGPNGIVYIVETAFQVVQMFDQKPNVLMALGGSGLTEGCLDLPAQVTTDATSIPYFKEYIHPDFNAEYLIFTTNQLGARKVNVYAFGAFPKDYKPGKEIRALPELSKTKTNSILNPDEAKKPKDEKANEAEKPSGIKESNVK